MSKGSVPLPCWNRVLSAAARLPRIPSDVMLVGGAPAIHEEHRYARDAEQVPMELRTRFDEVLAQLESVAGWKPARARMP